jgi:hypothetical protein
MTGIFVGAITSVRVSRSGDGAFEQIGGRQESERLYIAECKKRLL